MIRSMTGFGREQAVVSGREIIAEIRSVNHKFFEFSSKLPRNYQYLEPKLKTMLKEKITRGKVELSLLVYNIDVKDTSVKVNEQVASQYIEAIRTIAPDLGITDDLSASDLFRIPDVFTVIKEETDEEQLWADISSVVGSALDKFIAMRETEGAALKADVLEKADVIEDMVSKVEIYSPESTAAYRKKLEDKLKEILGSSDIDEQRILTEAAIFSEKTAVDEETVRLHSHLSQLRSMLDSDKEIGRKLERLDSHTMQLKNILSNSNQPDGKKLDFLVQEMNREANTIGSKAQDIEIAHTVVDIKAEIEKIREQIQNIE